MSNAPSEQRRRRAVFTVTFTRVSAALFLLSLCLLGLGLLIDSGWYGVMFVLYVLPVCAALGAAFGLSLLLLALRGQEGPSDPKRFFLRRVCPGLIGLLFFGAGIIYFTRAIKFITSIVPIEI